MSEKIRVRWNHNHPPKQRSHFEVLDGESVIFKGTYNDGMKAYKTMTDSEEAAITAICKRVLETQVKELRVDLNKAAEIIRRHNIRDADAVELCRTAPGCHTCKDFSADASREGICRQHNQQTHAHQICDEWN